MVFLPDFFKKIQGCKNRRRGSRLVQQEND
jgi:hypothetical protein